MDYIRSALPGYIHSLGIPKIKIGPFKILNLSIMYCLNDMLSLFVYPPPTPHTPTHTHRSSMSPNHSSVSPVSSGSDHSSRSPPTTHLPPPSSQPPPLPPSHTRPHPQLPPHSSPRINAHISTKRLGSNSAPGLRTPQQHHPSGHVTGHVTLAPRSRKPYENHHIHYPKHTVGPIPPSQHSSGVSGQYHWVPRPSGVGKPSYGPIIQDAGQSNSSVYAYDPVAPSNSMGVVNSKLVPTKMYPTVTETAHLSNSHLSNRGSPDNGTNEVSVHYKIICTCTHLNQTKYMYM